jgi:uncharacterized membrane protein
MQVEANGGIGGRLTAPVGGRANVGQVERALSVAAGAALAVMGLRKRNLSGAALALVGAELTRRGVSGHCRLYDALGVRTRGDIEQRDDVTSRAATVNARKAIKVERDIHIERPANELYHLWRDFSNLPRFMQHLESVECSDDEHSHWVARLPGGAHLEWDSEIVNDIPGQLIAWKTVGSPDVAHAGSIHFTASPNDRGTDVRLVFDYEPPFAGTIGDIASHLGLSLEKLVDADLRRLKEAVESGATTSAGMSDR